MEINQNELAQQREEIVKQRLALDRQLEVIDKDKIKFSVDAGLIDRLGRELVGKQETAVSELVKNAYDADAREVTLTFINSDTEGGTLIIDDDGHGMDMDSLRNGFMRISSTDKVHTPVSPKFNRKRAGRKGIGRFATHRLGKNLTITTQTADAQKALQLTINWDDYTIDRDLLLITNNVEEIPKTKTEGTTLTINILRESWSLSEIKRVFRYVSDLLQPSYLSDRLKKSDVVFASQEDASFSVHCRKITNGFEELISDIDKSFFKKSLAIFEGFVDETGKGFCFVESKSLGLKQSDNELTIEPSENLYDKQNWIDGKSPKTYLHLNQAQVHFKSYYFIYNRVDYYEGDGIGISTSELKLVNEFGNKAGGIKLYRNGFRVAPYGDIGDDWIDIDERFTSEGGKSGKERKNVIPFGNRNIFGFVEIVDENGILFEETSSREGLLKNDVFDDLVDYLRTAFQACRRRLESTVEFKEKRAKRQKRIVDEKTQKERLQQLRLFVEEKTSQSQEGQTGEGAESSFDTEELKATVEEVERIIDEQIDEIAMLRVLAGMGLSIGEFVHEFRQFSPAFDGNLRTLARKSFDENTLKIIHNLRANFDLFKIYASYFDETVQENAQRKLRLINIREPIRNFLKNIEHSGQREAIHIEHLFEGYELYTLPMHPSEWASILINLYSNSKKAIDKVGVKGHILITAKEENNRIVLEFSDNGIGIPEENKERVFHAFFTTSMPASRRTPQEKEFTGSGLGLKIVSDIIESYEGEVYVSKPPKDLKTCIRIEVPKATEAQIQEQYG